MVHRVVLCNSKNYKILLKNSVIELEKFKTTWLYMDIIISDTTLLKLKTKLGLTFRHCKGHKPETVIAKMDIFRIEN